MAVRFDIRVCLSWLEKMLATTSSNEMLQDKTSSLWKFYAAFQTKDIVAYPVASNNTSENMPAHHCDIVEIQILQSNHYK